MNIDTSTALERALEPLLDVFNRDFSTGTNKEYRIQSHDPFSELELSQDQVALVLPSDVTSHEPAMRAIVTLLRGTGGHPHFSLGAVRPLLFSLKKQVAWDGGILACERAIIAEYLGSKVDAADAVAQVADLVPYLEDAANLVELGPEERAIF